MKAPTSQRLSAAFGQFCSTPFWSEQLEKRKMETWGKVERGQETENRPFAKGRSIKNNIKPV